MVPLLPAACRSCPAIFPTTQFVSLAGATPQQHCQTVLSWLMVAVGALLPLSVLVPIEWRARRRAKAEAARLLPPHLRQPEVLGAWEDPLLPRSVPLVNAYLASCLVWTAASSASLYLRSPAKGLHAGHQIPPVLPSS